jgi:hypothetical protein
LPSFEADEFWLCTGRRFAKQISFAASGFTLRAA